MSMSPDARYRRREEDVLRHLAGYGSCGGHDPADVPGHACETSVVGAGVLCDKATGRDNARPLKQAMWRRVGCTPSSVYQAWNSGSSEVEPMTVNEEQPCHCFRSTEAPSELSVFTLVPAYLLAAGLRKYA